MHDKSNALAGMVGKMAHDLRTPLAVVHTTTNMLLNPRYQLSPEQVGEQHERIRRNAEILNRLIGELADLAQLGAGGLTIESELLTLSEVLREAMMALEVQAREAGLNLSVETSEAGLQLQADHARLLQMLQSVIGFALSTAARGSQARVSSRQQDGAAIIDVKVGGVALSADDLAQVLDPASDYGKRVPKIAGGFGLYIAKGIAEAHGGSLRCNPAAGDMVFSISLPLKA